MAESFGDLDPRIDARENDVPKKEWSGFHVIEKALWEEDTAKGMAPVAEQLQADVEELEQKVKSVDLQAVQIANGANELLGEVSASKITGEEERYSHIDLVDFEANVEGAEAAFESVEPIVSEERPEAGQGNRSPASKSLRVARALPQGRRLRLLHGADQGRHPQAGAGNRCAGRAALAGAGGDRRRGIVRPVGQRPLAGGSCPEIGSSAAQAERLGPGSPATRRWIA